MFTAEKKFEDLPPGSAAELIFHNREKILSLWVKEIKKKVPRASNEPKPIIINTLPVFMENLVEALAPNFPRKLATDGNTVATEHGGERARLTHISPADLIKEYQLLREVIFEFLQNKVMPTDEEISIILRSIDEAMEESLTSYFLVHQGFREQFISTLTHDMRTPLTAIKALCDYMIKYPEKTKDSMTNIKRIVDNVSRLDRMIEDLLDASQVTFGEKIKYKMVKCELKSLVEEVTTHLSEAYPDRFVVKGDPITGYWNREAFKRAIENLLVNAIKYGDPQKPVEIKFEECHGRLILSVHNDGSYIPKEEQEVLFQSFMRAKNTGGEKRGWGLGLAIVRGMAEGHGGSITIDSGLDSGTTFFIDVPVDARPFVESQRTPGT